MVPESRREDLMSARRRVDLIPKSCWVDLFSARRRVDLIAKRLRVDLIAERLRVDLLAERLRVDLITERWGSANVWARMPFQPENKRGQVDLFGGKEAVKPGVRRREAAPLRESELFPPDHRKAAGRPDA
ncbi:hypothetical protein WISP_00266 [Willisornis vidua]|uniref:Uncharacterized protein n=1 Tax=Willisornis vidua TaxID=1566151 RepID=A0ABQ9CPF7_9PASS|nr:hypothetical protein WISP_00266 [Willisornis vidua]